MSTAFTAPYPPTATSGHALAPCHNYKHDYNHNYNYNNQQKFETKNCG
jgi:hypothetical protein